jgi:parvulin-like peptidyl-prolyl isomerase
LPTEDDVNNAFRVQKELFMQQNPDKVYETALKEAGQTVDEIREQERVQLATTALYAKLLKIDESDVRSMYDRMKNVYSLPARVQLRVVFARENSPDLAKAQQEFAANKPFETIAREINLPQLRNLGGLLPQMMPINRLPPALQGQVSQSAVGATLGPIDFQRGYKAWVKVEKRYPEFKIPQEDAAPLVRRQLVQQKLSDPANADIRNQMLQLKLQATFKTEDKGYETVWNALKSDALKAGVGQQRVVAPPPVAPIPTGAPAK